MHRWRTPRSGRGIAEIVGTLMLVLIVVAAAVAFAASVASYQGQLAQEQTLEHDRSLELIRVLSVSPGPVNATGFVPSLNFTIASEYIFNSTITEFLINGFPVGLYNITALNLTTGAFSTTSVLPGFEYNLYPREQATVLVNFSSPGHRASFYQTVMLHPTDFVKIEMYTTYGNDFSRVFIPPTAVALVDTLTPGPVTVLDGTQSFQPEGNASVIQWKWTVVPTIGTIQSYSGEEAQTASQLVAADGPYTIHLTVTNSDGLVGVTSIVYPGS